uniref:Mcl1_mid domain-containing protein n=1 Tax=Caenorhabditis japonica TaxID=281687 RepID=A0A8R1HVH1_CAEJA
MASSTNIKSLHNTGIQKICVDLSGVDKENVYVCDADGIVLKFNKKSLVSDEKPTVIEFSDATNAAIAWNGENICVGYTKIDYVAGSEKQVVGRVKGQNFDQSEIGDQLEFQLPVTTVDANEENVVGGSTDYTIKCTSLKDPDAEMKTRSLDGEPLCVKLDPKNEYVAVSTVDGNVTILNLDTFSIAHTIKQVFSKFESIDVSRPLIQLCWSTDGKWLFVPSNGSVKSFRRNGWEDAGVYRLKDHESADFSVATISPCGTYLAASTMANQVAVWNTEKMELVSCESYTRHTPGFTVITSLEFSPFSPKQLIIADSNKGISLFDAFESTSSDSKVPSKKRDSSSAAIEDDDDDEDDDDLLLLNRTTNKKSELFDNVEEEDDEDTRMSSDLGAIKKQFGYGNADLGGLEEFGFKVGEAEPDQQFRPMSAQAPPPVFTEPPPPRKVLIPEQFVCSSSPVDPEATQRYLKYNRFGIVRTYVNEPAKVSNIDSRKKEKELDKTNEDIEDLDAETEKKEKKGTSVLHVIPINSFGNQPWSMTMPRGDGVVDVLVSKSQVVVLTKLRHVRIFTIGGVQRQIFTHPAPILTATCFEDRIAIASVAGSEFYENRKTPQWRFEICEYSLNQRSWYKDSRNRTSLGAVTRVDVPVESGEQLDWIGYSSLGKLAVMDSAYNVNFLSAPGLWVPVFQGSSVLRAPSDGIFPVGMTAKEFRYIYCRGCRSPLVAGINAPATVAWKFPFCQLENPRTDMEHSLFLNELFLADAILDKDDHRASEETKKLTTTIIKLFAFLAKTNSDGPAAEVAALVNGGRAATAKTIQSLCNYASKCKKVALSNKVAELGRKLTDEEDDRRDEDEELRPAPTKRIVHAARKKIPTVVEKRISEEEEDEDEDGDRTRLNLDMDDTSASPIPLIRTMGKAPAANPFAKGPSSSSDSIDSSQATLSIFDQLETAPVDNRKKRARENEPAVSQAGGSTRKQAKLNFGGNGEKRNAKKSVVDKENLVESVETMETEEVVTKKSVSPYEMWLSESKSSLQLDFDGEDAEFSKFCIQSFRALSKEQKEEWKAKARAL